MALDMQAEKFEIIKSGIPTVATDSNTVLDMAGKREFAWFPIDEDTFIELIEAPELCYIIGDESAPTDAFELTKFLFDTGEGKYEVRNGTFNRCWIPELPQVPTDQDDLLSFTLAVMRTSMNAEPTYWVVEFYN